MARPNEWPDRTRQGRTEEAPARARRADVISGVAAARWRWRGVPRPPVRRAPCRRAPPGPGGPAGTGATGLGEAHAAGGHRATVGIGGERLGEPGEQPPQVRPVGLGEGGEQVPFGGADAGVDGGEDGTALLGGDDPADPAVRGVVAAFQKAAGGVLVEQVGHHAAVDAEAVGERGLGGRPFVDGDGEHLVAAHPVGEVGGDGRDAAAPLAQQHGERPAELAHELVRFGGGRRSGAILGRHTPSLPVRCNRR